MTLRDLMMLFVVAMFQPLAAEAQHHQAVYHFQHFSQPFITYPGYVTGTYWPQTVAPYYPMGIASPYPPVVVGPIKAPPGPSAPAALLKSIDLQDKGDRYMREQKWSDAKSAYSNSVKSAPDRVGAHFRLALCNVAIHRYETAISELKLALLMDPTLPKTAPKLDVVFGADGAIALNAIISRLGEWVGEDLRNSDRLFLLGAILYFKRDARANDAFQAALRVNKNGEVGHITAFLNQPAEPSPIQPQPPLDGLPPLKGQPAAQDDVDFRFPKSFASMPAMPIPGAPVPMP